MDDIKDSEYFPKKDDITKGIALLGYTGVGKTSLITAGYFENVAYGKDAFTKRFFQRMEEEIRLHGEIPLTMGDASTLSFIEPTSRNEFTIQDFSGEHIKLERQQDQSYQDLILRADNAHSLVCLISAASFYRSKSQIQEEVDAIQSFVNQLLGLGTRIPVVVALTKCDMVPRFYSTLPGVSFLARIFSALPFMGLHPSQGLERTRRRFPAIFSGLSFQGKGPKTVFLGMALPRLAKWKVWNWPKLLQWIPMLIRKVISNPDYMFQSNYQLPEPFHFSFQAFQLSILRSSLVRHHSEPETCEKLIESFAENIIEKNAYGKEFYLKEYFDRIHEDTKQLIRELDEELESLTSDAKRLLSNENNLRENLHLWLKLVDEKLKKFNKPWSEGAKKSLLELRHKTVAQICDNLQEWLKATLADKDPGTFYRLTDILHLRRAMESMDIWEEENLSLPEVETLKDKLLEHLVALTVSRQEISSSLFENDLAKYKEVMKDSRAEELPLLVELVEKSIIVVQETSKYRTEHSDWPALVLNPLKEWEKSWVALASHFHLPPESPLRFQTEKKALECLEIEASHYPSFKDINYCLEEIRQLVHNKEYDENLNQISETIQNKSKDIIDKSLEEMTTKSESIWLSAKHLDQSLENWYRESESQIPFLEKMAGHAGKDQVKSLQKEICAKAKTALEERYNNLDQKKKDRGSFIQSLDLLHLFQSYQGLDFVAAFGIVPPDARALEKHIFRVFCQITIGQSHLTTSSYQEDRARFIPFFSEDNTHLQSLDKITTALDNLKTKAREGAKFDYTTWEKSILEELQTFYQGWLELSEYLPSSGPTLRDELEELNLRLLKDSRENFTLQNWQDIQSHLAPIDTESAIQNLENLIAETKEEIRQDLEKDLRAFLSSCENMEKTLTDSSTLEVATWYKFVGSLKALERSVYKFPLKEFSMNEETVALLEEKVPQAFVHSAEKWWHSLDKNRLLNQERCQEIAEATTKAKTFFRHPEILYPLEKLNEEKQKQLQARRKVFRGLIAVGVITIVLIGAALWQRDQKIQEVQQVLATESQDYPNYTALINKWQAMQNRAGILVADQREEIVRQIRRYQALQSLEELHQQVNAKEFDTGRSENITNQLRTFFEIQEQLSPQIKSKALRITLENRARTLLAQLEQSEKDTGWWQEQLQELRELEKEVQVEIPVYQCKYLTELKNKIETMKK